MSKPFILAVSASLSIGALFCSPVSAALNQKEIEAKITEAKILQPGDKISSAVRPEEVVVHKYKAADSVNTEKDCKIEAVLIGKVVMTADPSVKKVKVRFFERLDRSKYSEVLIRAGDIKAFASGMLSQSDLLASLDLVYGTDAAAANALNPVTAPASSSATTSGESSAEAVDGVQGTVPGPLQVERKALLDRIRRLNEQGINTQNYSKQFLVVEEKAKAGDRNDTAELLDGLSASVADQEKRLSSRGKRPSATTTASAGPQTQPASSAEDSSNSSSSNEGGLEGMMYKFFAKRYGNFTPVFGPYQEERNYISGTIIRHQQAGQQVKHLEPIVLELNKYAKSGDTATLRKKIDAAYAYLHIPTLQVYMRTHHHNEHSEHHEWF